MIYRDEVIRNQTLKHGELYKRCTLIDCVNQGAILDECVQTSGTPIEQPQADVNEPSNTDF